MFVCTGRLSECPHPPPTDSANLCLTGFRVRRGEPEPQVVSSGSLLAHSRCAFTLL